MINPSDIINESEKSEPIKDRYNSILKILNEKEGSYYKLDLPITYRNEYLASRTVGFENIPNINNIRKKMSSEPNVKEALYYVQEVIKSIASDNVFKLELESFIQITKDLNYYGK